MATYNKLYLCHFDRYEYHPGFAASFLGAWGTYAISVCGIHPLKAGTNNSGHTTAETVTTNPFSGMVVCGVSPPMKAQTVSAGTFDVCIGANESAADADAVLKIHAYVMDANAAFRFTVIDKYIDTGHELPTTQTFVSLLAPIAYGAFTTLLGDKLVIEFGYQVTNTTATSKSVTIRAGARTDKTLTGTALADGAVGGTDTTTKAGWVNFSTSIDFVDPPANDACASPIVIGAIPYTESLYRYHMTAVPSSTEDVHPTNAGTNEGYFHTAWYQWTAPGSAGSVYVEVANPSAGNQGFVTFFTGSCGALTQVFSTDFSGRGGFTYTPGTTYLIALSDRLTSDGGSYSLKMLSVSDLVTNNECATAIDITSVPYSIPSMLLTSTSATKNAATDPIVVDPGDFQRQPNQSLWWTFTPASTGRYRICTNGSNYQTTIAVYTGACGGPFTLVDNLTDTTDGLSARNLYVTLTAGTPYKIVIGNNSTAGTYLLTLSITAAPASRGNVTWRSALDLTASLPLNDSIVLGDEYDELWYKIVGDPLIVLFGVFAYVNQSTANYKAKVTPWSDVGTGSWTAPYFYALNRPSTYPLVNGVTTYFTITPVPAVADTTPNSTPVQLKIQLAPNFETDIGAYVVPDDSSGFPAVVMATDGSWRKALAFPAGEVAAVSMEWFGGNKNILTQDISDGSMKLFDPQLTLLSTPLTSGYGSSASPVAAWGTNFYVVKQSASAPTITRVSNAGVVGTVFAFTGQTQVTAAGISPDETILYFYPVVPSAFGQPLKRFSLTSSTLLSDLLSGVANHLIVSNIVTLADGSLVVGYSNQSQVVGVDYVVRVSAAGTLLNTYSAPADVTLDRLATALDGESFHVWWHIGNPATGSRFQKIRASDGVVLQTFDATQFELGESSVDPTDFDSAVLFGHSNSCPFFVMSEPLVGDPFEVDTPDPPTTPGTIPPPTRVGDCCAPPNGPSTPGGSSPPGTGSIGGGGSGSSGSNEGGSGWTSDLCGFGGEAMDYPTVLPAESFAGVRALRLWLECRFNEYPSGDVTPLLLAYGSPINDPPTYQGGRKAGTIRSVGRITRSLSNEEGDYVGSQTTARINDASRTFRHLLASESTKHLTGREANWRLASQAQIDARGDQTIIFRGVVSNHPLSAHLGASLAIEDLLTSEVGPFSGRRFISDRLLTVGLFPGIPRELIGKTQKIIGGPYTDAGAVVPGTGVSAEKGLIPIDPVGTLNIGGVDYLDCFICGHAIVSVDLYASNEDASARYKIPLSDYGSLVLAPGKPGWPFPHKYIDQTDADTGLVHRTTRVFLKIGSVYADAQLTGQINVAANVCGIEDRGNGLGTLVTEYFTLVQILIDNWMLPSPGYYTGLYTGSPQWADGTYMTCSESFRDAQAKTVEFIGGRGYQSAFVLDTQMLSREVIKQIAITGHCGFAWSRAGQLMVKIADDTLDISTTPRLRTPYQIRAGMAPTFAVDSVENPITVNFDFDYDKRKWRGASFRVYDDVAIQRMKRERPSTVECYFTRDEATARDAQSRRLLWKKYPHPIVPIEMPVDGMDYELGDTVRASNQDGLGDGYVDQPLRIISTSFDPATNRTVHLAVDSYAVLTQKSVFKIDSDPNVREFKAADDPDAAKFR